MKKEIPKKGYRTLAIIWTLATASISVAFVRHLTFRDFNLFLLLLVILSTLTAANFWKAYHRTPEKGVPDPFSVPPKFADNPELFDDPVPPAGGRLFTGDDSSRAHGPNQDSEEKNHE